MLGQKIKQLRLDNDITQKELADFLGVTPKAISFYELGQRMPSPEMILKMANKFNVTTDFLLGNEEIPSQDGYYLDPEAAKMAQELYDNPGMRILFDAARNVSADDLKLAAEIIGRMKKEEEHDVD